MLDADAAPACWSEGWNISSSFHATTPLPWCTHQPMRLVPCAPPALPRPAPSSRTARPLLTLLITTTLQVVTGSDKGKVATIKSVCSKTGKIIVEGVNIKTNCVAPMKEGETGKLEQKEYPIHHSNVMLYSTTQNVRSRVGHKEVDGKKVRYLIKTGEVLN